MVIYQKYDCNDCEWNQHGECDTSNTCSCFSPVSEIEDDYIDELIEINRIEFWKDWFEYFDELEG